MAAVPAHFRCAPASSSSSFHPNPTASLCGSVESCLPSPDPYLGVIDRRHHVSSPRAPFLGEGPCPRIGLVLTVPAPLYKHGAQASCLPAEKLTGPFLCPVLCWRSLQPPETPPGEVVGGPTFLGNGRGETGRLGRLVSCAGRGNPFSGQAGCGKSSGAQDPFTSVPADQQMG